jgi:integrase/recombinase XerD
MPSVKIIHYTKKIYTDGTSPVILQIISGKTIKRKVIFSIKPEHWDSKNKEIKARKHPDFGKLNADLSDEYARIKNLLKEPSVNLDTIFDKNASVKIVAPSFKEVAKLYVSSLKSGFSMLTYENRLNKFIEKSGIGDLPCSAITRKHIDNFVKSYACNKESSIRTNIKIIRYACTFAFKNGYDTKPVALFEYKLPKATPGVKNKLTKPELLAFENYPASGKLLQDRDVFMLSIYLWGMRIGDMIQIKQEYIKNGRIVYTSGKSEDDFNIKLNKQALEIIERYLDGREYLFHYFKWKENASLSAEENKKGRANHIKTITANINKGINFIAEEAGIKKHVSAHIGRHTFAKMAIESANDINTSMAFLGHNNVAVHQAYIKEIMRSDELDDAADKIFE